MDTSLKVLLVLAACAALVAADFLTDTCGPVPVYDESAPLTDASFETTGFHYVVPAHVLTDQSCGTANPDAYNSNACAIGDQQMADFASNTQKTLSTIDLAAAACDNYTQMLEMVHVVHQTCGQGFAVVSQQWKNCQNSDRSVFLGQVQEIADYVQQGNVTYCAIGPQLKSEYQNGMCVNCVKFLVYLWRIVGYLASCLFQNVFSRMLTDESAPNALPGDCVQAAYTTASRALSETMATVPYGKC